MSDVEKLVADRGRTNGDFEDHARATQRLKSVVSEELNYRASRGQPPLSFMQTESLDMILHKIGRILAGDPSFADHWDDIKGYAHIANGSKPVQLELPFVPQPAATREDLIRSLIPGIPERNPDMAVTETVQAGPGEVANLASLAVQRALGG